jgi:hypothetical protein
VRAHRGLVLFLAVTVAVGACGDDETEGADATATTGSLGKTRDSAAGCSTTRPT